GYTLWRLITIGLLKNAPLRCVPLISRRLRLTLTYASLLEDFNGLASGHFRPDWEKLLFQQPAIN
ncbi:MAG: hypothetical protein NTZ51_02860, partial [Proteobacteria bacterium]|nr:hypothetical protein [Pseudomonadota bacterium]